MLFIFDFNGLSNGVLSVFKIVMLGLIFIGVPYLFFTSVGLMWAGGEKLVVIGLAAAVIAFLASIFSKRRASVIASGVVVLVAVGYIAVRGPGLAEEAREAVAFGAPRNILWAEAMYDLTPTYPTQAGPVEILPEPVRTLLAGVSVSRHEREIHPRIARRIELDGYDVIEVTHYRVIPGAAFDDYIAIVNEGHGDWLAFYATCVLHSECSVEHASLDDIFAAARDRYSIDLKGALTQRLTAAGLDAEGDFLGACGQAPACARLMSRLGYSVVVN